MVKPLWGKRIGTTILRAAAAIANSIDLKYIKVVGILDRGGDAEVHAFYRANRPNEEHCICLRRPRSLG